MPGKISFKSTVIARVTLLSIVTFMFFVAAACFLPNVPLTLGRILVLTLPPIVSAALLYSMATSCVMYVTFYDNNTIAIETLTRRKTMPVTALHRLTAKTYRDRYNGLHCNAWLQCATGKYYFDGDQNNDPFWEFLAEVQQRNPRIQVDDYFLA